MCVFMKVCTSHHTLVTVGEKKPIINKHGHFPKGRGARATTVAREHYIIPTNTTKRVRASEGTMNTHDR